MELKTAIEVLDYHQEWRLGKRDDMIHEPKALTEALDRVLDEVKKNSVFKEQTKTYFFCTDEEARDAFDLPRLN